MTKLQNNKGLDIDVVNITNSNNYSFSFYTYGGYMNEVRIPTSSDNFETEDVLLGYGTLDDCLEAHGYFNSIIGRVCNRIGQSKFTLNGQEYNLYSIDHKKDLSHSSASNMKKFPSPRRELPSELSIFPPIT